MMTTTYPDTPRGRGDHDAPHMSPVTPEEDARTILINRVSWGAVLAGVVVALVVHLILNMLGVGIGAATLDPLTSDNPSPRGFSVAASLWWTVSGILASLAGGYTAGRLSGQPKEASGAWHGLTAWALTTLVIFYLLGSAVGGLVGGAYSALSTAVGGFARTAGETAKTAVQAAAPSLGAAADPFASIEQSIRSASGGTDPGALRDAAIASVRAALTGDPALAADARERAAQAISKAENVSIEDARNRVQGYEKQYRQSLDTAKQKAEQAADIAAKTISRGALFGAIALVLGAIAAWFGGRMGVVDPTLTRTRLLGR